MLARFKTNITLYPRLFTVTLVGILAAEAESFIPLLTGIDQQHLRRIYVTEFLVALVLAGLLYRWITTNSGRTSIMLDILNRFEGREVCNVADHVEELEESEDTEEDNPETYA